MLYREIIAVCSQIHTKHIKTMYGQNLQGFLLSNLVVPIVTTGLYRFTSLNNHCHTPAPNAALSSNTTVPVLAWRIQKTHLLEISHHLSQPQPHNSFSWFPHTYKSVHRGLSSRLEWLAVNNNTCSYWTSFEITWGSQVDAAARGCDVTHSQ